MKLLLISGHGNGDPGALGNGFRECDLTRDVVLSLKDELLSKYSGVDVEVYPTNRNAYQDVQNGSFVCSGYDYVFEVHFNAFNGNAKGTEIFVTNNTTNTAVENMIVTNLSKHFTNRGVKKSDFLVIKTIKNRGMNCSLIELCFIDNKVDMDIYKANTKSIVNEIAKGLGVGFKLKEKQTMQNGWLKEEGLWYYLKGGVKQTKWLQLGNNWYWLDEKTGIMSENCWQCIGGSFYFFHGGGSMASNVTILGRKIDSSGRMIENKNVDTSALDKQIVDLTKVINDAKKVLG